MLIYLTPVLLMKSDFTARFALAESLILASGFANLSSLPGFIDAECAHWQILLLLVLGCIQQYSKLRGFCRGYYTLERFSSPAFA